jgi:dihydroorotate dehydrogenase
VLFFILDEFQNSFMIYKKILRPILFRWDSEAVHDFVLHQLSRHYRQVEHIRSVFQQRHPALTQTISSLKFVNPVGLAAGFDKYAQALPVWTYFGFGFAEIGTITAEEQPGNARPRLFRLTKDHALINRFGFNNQGALKTAAALHVWEQEQLLHTIPIGINIGKTKTVASDQAFRDYLFTFEKLWPYADYFTINVSSPNTPNLRELQERKFLEEILATLNRANQDLAAKFQMPVRPVFVKIAPDLAYSKIDEVLDVVEAAKINGIIAVNTTVQRENLLSGRKLISEAGGLSGKPLQKASTEIIRYIYRNTQRRLIIIGCGGIFNADDAYEKIKAGASLIQIYTGFIYEGPSISKKINRGLVRLIQKDGFRNISEAVGAGH